jgi:hypothetical protein
MKTPISLNSPVMNVYKKKLRNFFLCTNKFFIVFFGILVKLQLQSYLAKML